MQSNMVHSLTGHHDTYESASVEQLEATSRTVRE